MFAPIRLFCQLNKFLEGVNVLVAGCKVAGLPREWVTLRISRLLAEARGTTVTSKCSSSQTEVTKLP